MNFEIKRGDGDFPLFQNETSKGEVSPVCLKITGMKAITTG